MESAARVQVKPRSVPGTLMQKEIPRPSYQTPIIPPTPLVVRSYSTCEMHAQPSLNPTNTVGGSFIRSLTNVHVPNLSSRHSDRLDMNDPPTALVGFGSVSLLLCRPGVNQPPTALVGFPGNGIVLSAFSATCQARPERFGNHHFSGSALTRLTAIQIK